MFESLVLTLGSFVGLGSFRTRLDLQGMKPFFPLHINGTSSNLKMMVGFIIADAKGSGSFGRPGATKGFSRSGDRPNVGSVE